MRLCAFTLLISSFVLLGGCKESATNQQSSTNQQSVTANQAASVSQTPTQGNANASPPPASASPGLAAGNIDACKLLTSAEIQAVQGEAVKETKASQQASGGLISSQCYYTLPTSSKSISLAVTETDPAKTGQTTAKEFWQKTFRGRAEEEREGERDRDEKSEGGKGKGEKREEEEGAPPKPVKGIGDEAFWTASRVGGALYVLKGDKFIRISIGGPLDEEMRLSKSKQLAQKALGRL